MSLSQLFVSALVFLQTLSLYYLVYLLFSFVWKRLCFCWLFYILICILLICLALNCICISIWIHVWYPYISQFSELCLHLVCASNLNLTSPVSDLCKVVTSENPFGNQSVLVLLFASHINIPYQNVWERLNVWP